MSEIPDRMIEVLESGEEVALACARTDEKVGGPLPGSDVVNCSECGCHIHLSGGGQEAYEKYPGLVKLICTSCILNTYPDVEVEGAIGLSEALMKKGVDPERYAEVVKQVTNRPVKEILEDIGYRNSRNN